ncbi:hypothetical protein M3Y99_01064400 [Aphelenchoides fujianensis]|nr:hypothetical protein M3Y99_01064400 [Aphelenchoides fujianensis]
MHDCWLQGVSTLLKNSLDARAPADQQRQRQAKHTKTIDGAALINGIPSPDSARMLRFASLCRRLRPFVPAAGRPLCRPISGTQTPSTSAPSPSLQAKYERPEDEFACFPEAPHPQLCCGSGCHNCIWIQYADAVEDHLHEHHAEEAGTPEERWAKIERILALKVPDPNLRMYLEMEMKSKVLRG